MDIVAYVVLILFIVVLIGDLIMTRQEVARLRSIVDQCDEELKESDTDEQWARGWARIG